MCVIGKDTCALVVFPGALTGPPFPFHGSGSWVDLPGTVMHIYPGAEFPVIQLHESVVSLRQHRKRLCGGH